MSERENAPNLKEWINPFIVKVKVGVVSTRGETSAMQPLNNSSLPKSLSFRSQTNSSMFRSFITICQSVHKSQIMHSYLFLTFCLAVFISITTGEQLILANNCNETVWPGILGNSGHQTPMDGGFHLGSGKHVVVEVPKKWSGRIWGRQGCSFSHDGKGSCDTGDCSGRLHCRGTAGIPPATIVEVTLGSSISPLHYYDVSLVDGFNLPLSMKPIGGGIGCGIASCDIDVNIFCPSALEVKKKGKVVGCKSACLAMQSAKYCCTGKYANPKTCRPTLFAHLFKAMCPKAYTYAFDDPSSLRKCKVSRYAITFCPSM